MTVHTSFTIQYVTKVRARAAAGLSSAPVTICFEGEDWRNGVSEITIHTDNAELSSALANAINEAVRSVKAKQAEQRNLAETVSA
jgi:hypothetical protein